MRLRKLSILALALLVAVGGVAFINPKRAFATPNNCIWTGSAGDSMFSTTANWTGCNGTYPQAGDNMIFGTAVGSKTIELTGVTEETYGSITFDASGYYIAQNRLDVTGGVTDNSSGGENEIASDLGVFGSSAIEGGNSNLVLNNAIVGSSSTVSFARVTVYKLAGGGGMPSVLNIGPSVVINDASAGGLTGINVNRDFSTAGPLKGGPITIAGGSTFTVSANNLVTGEVDVSNNATLVLDGTVTGNIDVANGGTIKGSGTESGATTIEQGGIVAPGHSPGCLTTGNLTINGTYQAEIGGTTPCSGYDQLTGTNLVDVTNGTLDVSLVNGFTPSAGQTFTIVDDQDTGPVTGTFSGLPEGSTVTAGGYTFKISYVGGTGNDIVLTAVGPSSGAKAVGTPDTGLAALTTHPLATLVSTVVAALMIVAIARRLQPVKR